MTRSVRWLATWNVVVTMVLIAAIGAATTQAKADDRFSVFTGTQAPLNDGGDGSSATVDDIIDSTAADTLVSVTTTGLSVDHPHICLVTASAEATFVADGTFIFGLSLDGATTSTASNRRIEMFNNAGINDDSFEEVSTTLGFAGLAGDHTFTFSARKSAASGGNLNVSASAMTVVCMKTDL